MTYFVSVSSDDEGTYSCLASNLASQTEERLQVIVSQEDYTGLPSYPEDNRGGRHPAPADKNYSIAVAEGRHCGQLGQY